MALAASSNSGSATQTPALCDILNRESCYPVYDQICSLLEINDIISLCRTCKGLSTMYKDLLLSQWNIDHLLAQFFRDPKGFRSQMAEHHALVSGNIASEFFSRQRILDYDMAVFVQHNPDVGKLEKYLTDVEGYTVYSVSNNKGEDPWIEELQEFRRTATGTSPATVIELVLTSRTPLHALLSDSDATVEVDFFTWNKAFALFPILTFVEYKMCLLKPIDEVCEENLTDEQARGWKLESAVILPESKKNNSIQKLRYVGDRYTWMIPFDITDVTPSKTPDHVVETAGFNMDEIQGVPVPYYNIIAHVFRTHVLRHEYIFPRELDLFKVDVGRKMDRETLFQLHRLPEDDRPAKLDQIRQEAHDLCNHDALSLFRGHEHKIWHYLDAKLLGWLLTYLSERGMEYPAEWRKWARQ